MTAALRLDQLIARAVAGPRDEPAIFWQEQIFNWGWLADTAKRVIEALEASGADSDAPVGFIPRQRPEAHAAFVGMLADQRSMTMMYSYQSTDAMGADLRKLRLGAVVAHEQDWDATLIKAAREVGTAGISLAPHGAIAAVPGIERVGYGDHRPAPPEPSIELLTSGTTGPPKRHSIPYEQFRRSMLDSSFTLGDGMGDRRPALSTVPLANISGIYGSIVAVATRRPTIVEDKFTLPVWLDYVRKYRPANISGPPALVKMILDANVAPEDLSSAKFMTIGMGPVDPNIRRAFEARYGIPILPAYGATEFVGAAAAMTLDDLAKYGNAKFGSVGRPVSGVTLRIRDQATGELVAQDDERVGLVEVLHDGIGPEWIKTNDLGRLDPDGFLYLLGRADGVIIRGGFKIHPSTIETVLLQHPAVASCAVVALPHERLGHVPVVAIQPRCDIAPPTREDLDAWLRKQLPATNIPADYRIVPQLPLTPSLKVRVDAVLELFAPDVASVSDVSSVDGPCTARVD